MHKYTDLVMKFSAMVGNELVLERENKKLFTKWLWKLLFCLKIQLFMKLHVNNGPLQQFVPISNFLSSTQEKMGDHILPLSFSDFTDCFTRISWEEISGTLTSLLVDISLLDCTCSYFPLIQEFSPISNNLCTDLYCHPLPFSWLP